MIVAAADDKQIFLRALDFESADLQTAYIESACQHDPQLRSRALALLHAHHAAGRFLGGVQPDSASPPAEVAGHAIGPYTLVRELGTGGMGVVWLAEQLQPVRRRVALKVIRPGLDSAQVLARFAAEREALALMDHPNIAKVLDAGTVEGARAEGWGLAEQAPESPSSSPTLTPSPSPSSRPFFVMELVDGVSLTQFCDDRKLPIVERLKLFIAVCHAVQHAHQKGVIHRDIKPSNVLVAEYDGQPTPKVIDFGIAKAIGEQSLGQTRFTVQGQIIGTPEYMAPEQAEFDPSAIDTRCDIYALGVLLYELLTGTTPFDHRRIGAANLSDWLRAIKEVEPQRPSACLPVDTTAETTASHRNTDPARLRKLLRGDLDWIVLKCLEKSRSRRYASAGSLADDIRRHLDGLPVEAHRPSRWYQAQKFVARNRGAVLAATTIAVLLVGGLLGTTAALYRADAAARNAIAANEQRRRTLYFSDIVAAQEAWNDNDLRHMEVLLRRQIPATNEEDLRSFEWYYLWQLLDRATTDTLELPFKARAAIYSPRGDTIAVSLHDGRVQLYDAATRRLLKSLGTELPESEHPTRVQFSRDGSKLAFQSRSRAIVHDLETGQERQCVAPSAMISLALSSDGRFLTGGTPKGQIHIWDLSKEGETSTRTIPSAPMARVQYLVFSHQGHRLVASGAGSPMQVYDLDELAGEPSRRTLNSESNAAAAVTAFSPDDRLLAVPTTNKKVRLFDMQKNDFHSPGAFVHDEELMGVAFSRDAAFLAVTSDTGLLHLWDMQSLKRLWVTPAHTGSALSVDFSPDGRTILTAGTDRALRFWPADQPGAVAHPEINEATRLNHVTTSGQHLVSVRGFGQRTLRIVEVNTWRELPLDFPGRDDVFAAAVSPQDTIAVTTQSGQLFLVHGLGESVVPLSISAKEPAQITALAFSPDGNLLALGRENGDLTFWDVPGARKLVAGGGTGRVNALRFSPDGQTLAEANGKDIVLWRPADRTPTAWREVGRLKEHWAAVQTIEFHPHDDGLLASGSSDDTVKLWRWRTQSPPQTLAGHMGTVFGLAFSPDGKLLASGGRDARVVLWDVATGQKRLGLKQEQPLVGQALVFARGGRTLYSGDWSKLLYVWEAASEQEVKQKGW